MRKPWTSNRLTDQQSRPAPADFLKNHTTLALALSLLLLASLFSLLRISGSSVAVLNSYLRPTGYEDSNLILGQPRGVRGDEWLVTTSLTLSQSHIDYAPFNRNIAFGQEMSVFGDAPTKHWSTFFKPHNWSFFVLPVENAVAFKWWFRGFFLIFVTYLLVKQLQTSSTRFSSISLALTASVVIFLAAFVQWWYSTLALESLSYFMLGAYAFASIIRSMRPLQTILFGLLLGFSGVALVLTLYPPFIIPLLLLGLLLAAGILANHSDSFDRSRIVAAMYGLGAAGIVALVGTLAYYIAFGDILSLMQDTEYPGRRVEVGGGLSFSQLLGGGFDFLLLEAEQIPAHLRNQSEASSGLFFYPWLAPAAILSVIEGYRKNRRLDFVMIGLLIYLAGMSFWLLFGLPAILERVLLLNRVPANRALIGLVAANILLVFYYLGSRPSSWSSKPLVAGALALIALLFHLRTGYSLLQDFPDYAGNPLNVWLVALSMAALTGALILRKRMIFLPGVILFAAFTGLSVNPLYRDLEPLTQAPIITQIQPIQEADPESWWVAYNSLIMGNVLLANGFPVINSVQFYPQTQLWLTLDPEQRFKKNWNRYAHVLFTNAPSKDSIEFVTLDYDSTTVVIDPCHPVLDELRVNYFLFASEPDAPCLELIASDLTLQEPVLVYHRR